jgi:hypothetical protein
MTDEEGKQLCEEIWNLLPADYEDAFSVLAMVVDRFLAVDETSYNREHFITVATP